jgi:Protein of unknown function (DUF2949)
MIHRLEQLEAFCVIFTRSSDASRTLAFIVGVLNPGFSMAYPKFSRFLRQDLAIPEAELRLAVRHPEPTPDTLPIILWQYSLVTLTELNQIFD